ncbi:MAG: hypothetical protein ACKVRN_01320 [Pyrinomonadaceae bacterium]
MSIRSNIEDMMQKIRDDASVGVDVQAKAVDAIKSGQGSPEWATYMNMFSTSEKELGRLLPDDETEGVFRMDVARTCLVGNGMCGAETTGSELLDGIDDILDENL